VTTQLTRAHILVADDQPDVARTLCNPLKHAGAILDFVSDGEHAYRKVDSRSFDLLIIDMKMPPNEWGGLWLLKKLGDGGWKIPALVLSGEGTKRQTIEALRLGASDWIDKSAAAAELEERCLATLVKTYSEALAAAAMRLPTVLASRLVQYSRTTNLEKRAAEGIRTLETVLRFIAILGLCTTPPRLLHGMRQQIARPTMGTWLTLCMSVAKASEAGKTFLNLSSCLMPDRVTRSQVQEQVKIRNAMAHSGYIPRTNEVQNLDDILTRFAHRANSTWRSALAVPTSMTYDGVAFTVSLMNLVGTNPPQHSALMTTTKLRTGQPVLIDPVSEPVSMFPWILTSGPDNLEQPQSILFDGVKLGKPNDFHPDSPLVYTNPSSGEHNIQPAERHDLIWQTISSWMD
jgi:DNA-binding response OmpR family regulator